MARASCPSCGAALRVGEAADKSAVTCPRCLAEVAITPAPAAPPAADPAALAQRACPECGQSVRADFRYCPYCNTLLRPRLTTDGLEREVARDSRQTGVGLIVLGVLAGIGTGLLACTGMWQGVGSGGDAGTVIVICGVVFLVLLVVGLVLRFGSRNPTARGAGRVLTTGLVSAGVTIAGTAVVVLIIVVVIMLVVALTLLAFVGQVCQGLGAH
jgi:hypothetical protein